MQPSSQSIQECQNKNWIICTVTLCLSCVESVMCLKMSLTTELRKMMQLTFEVSHSSPQINYRDLAAVKDCGRKQREKQIKHHGQVPYLWKAYERLRSGAGAELGGARGATAPQILPGPPSGPQKFSAWRHVTGVGLFLKVLHRPLTAPLVAKLAPPVAPPNENVWLRPWLGGCVMLG